MANRNSYNSSKTNFNKDIEREKISFPHIIKAIENSTGLVFVRQSDGDNPVERKQWDLLFKNEHGKLCKVEVKEEYKSYHSGNVTIEYSCNDKPSGLDTTDADYYAYLHFKTNRNMYLSMIRVDKLKSMRHGPKDIENGWHDEKFKVGESSNQTDLKLVRARVIQKHATKNIYMGKFEIETHNEPSTYEMRFQPDMFKLHLHNDDEIKKEINYNEILPNLFQYNRV